MKDPFRFISAVVLVLVVVGLSILTWLPKYLDGGWTGVGQSLLDSAPWVIGLAVGWALIESIVALVRSRRRR